MSFPRKTTMVLLALALGLVPGVLLASSAPVAAPVGAPAPATSNSAPLEVESSESLQVKVTEVQGDVSAKNGDVLHSGDTLKTGDGSCRLVINGSSTLWIEPQTTLKISTALHNIKDKSNDIRLDLPMGRLKVQLSKLKTGSTFEVTTPTAVATVRGTTFFLNTGNFQGSGGTEIYVDETKAGVLFKNIMSGKSVLVPAFSLSNSHEDGALQDPQHLTPEQRDAFIQKWETEVPSGASQQFGIEEIPLNPAGAPGGTDPLKGLFSEDQRTLVNDALRDKLAEQNIGGANGFPPVTILESPAPKTDDDTENPPDDEEPVQETPITPAEKNMVLETIDEIVDELAFDFVDANQARVADAQTGKTFKDVHGNRVRVEQYIFQPTDSSVMLMALTQREGEYQHGLTTAVFFTQFNRPITESDGLLRELPWNDYMKVVRRDDLEGSNAPGQFDQFIVYAHHDAELGAPTLFPLEMGAMFVSALSETTDFSQFGMIIFGETYTDPRPIQLASGETFYAQGVDEESLLIFHGAGEIISSTSNHSGGEHEVFTSFGGPNNLSFSSRDGAQSTGFSSVSGLGDLDTTAGLDAFRNANVHPAFFEETYGGARALYGVFLPIDDAGNVLEAPGFKLHGLRDAFNPNAQINGGHYNLEFIFAYGSVQDDTFSELFRIDAIYMPVPLADYDWNDPVNNNA